MDSSNLFGNFGNAWKAGCCRHLIRSIADRVVVILQDSRGDTPLHVAIAIDAKEMTEILISCPRVKFDIRNERGFNHLHLAALKGNSQ